MILGDVEMLASFGLLAARKLLLAQWRASLYLSRLELCPYGKVYREQCDLAEGKHADSDHIHTYVSNHFAVCAT